MAYESDISFLKNYKKHGDVVVKTYKKDSACIAWLNETLRNYYQFNTILPVAQHEFKALEILSEFDIAPKPIELGRDYIVMERYGNSISDDKIYCNHQEMHRQAVKILNIFESLNFKHNDLLPRNILYSKSSKLKVIDFTLSEFGGIELMDILPNKEWAYPGDKRILGYFNK